MAIIKSGITTIPISILQTWDLITDATKFHGIHIPGVWKKYDREQATKGKIIKVSSLWGSEWYDRLIVDFIKPHKFSFGGTRDDTENWSFMFELKEVDSQVTELKYSRKFANLNWYEAPFKRKKSEEGYQYLVDKTINIINGVAYRISLGEQDGVTQTDY